APTLWQRPHRTIEKLYLTVGVQHQLERIGRAKWIWYLSPGRHLLKTDDKGVRVCVPKPHDSASARVQVCPKWRQRSGWQVAVRQAVRQRQRGVWRGDAGPSIRAEVQSIDQLPIDGDIKPNL